MRYQPALWAVMGEQFKIEARRMARVWRLIEQDSSPAAQALREELRQVDIMGSFNDASLRSAFRHWSQSTGRPQRLLDIIESFVERRTLPRREIAELEEAILSHTKADGAWNLD